MGILRVFLGRKTAILGPTSILAARSFIISPPPPPHTRTVDILRPSVDTASIPLGALFNCQLDVAYACNICSVTLFRSMMYTRLYSKKAISNTFPLSSLQGYGIRVF